MWPSPPHLVDKESTAASSFFSSHQSRTLSSITKYVTSKAEILLAFWLQDTKHPLSTLCFSFILVHFVLSAHTTTKFTRMNHQKHKVERGLKPKSLNMSRYTLLSAGLSTSHWRPRHLGMPTKMGIHKLKNSSNLLFLVITLSFFPTFQRIRMWTAASSFSLLNLKVSARQLCV